MDKSLILLIDDFEPIRYALSELLMASGFSVVTAPDGRSGIEALSALTDSGASASLVITDLVMEDVPGYDVIEETRRRFPGCPVIAISGGSANMDPELPLDLAKRCGANVCLRKPFGNEELLAAVHSLVDRR